jgi:uncharacterized protein
MAERRGALQRCMCQVVIGAMLSVTGAMGQGRNPLIGSWDGAIAVAGTNLGIRVLIIPKGDTLRGTIDIPQQMALGMELKNIGQKGPEVHFELPAGPGLAVFDGILQSDSINGTFRQAGFTGTFSLARTRPEAVPYRVEEVNYRNDTIALTGTLTIPPLPGRNPALLLIGGSGALSRDEEVFGFPVFLRLADSLTRRGFIVLRYDKRGCGGSTGDLMSSTVEDLAGDALAGFRYLTERNEVSADHISLVGHSEGSAVAMVAASRAAEVSSVVSLAGASVSGERVILDQLERIAVAGGTPRPEIDSSLALERELFRALKNRTSLDSIARVLEDRRRADIERQLSTLPPERRKSFPSADSLARQRVNAELAAVQSRWYRHFLEFDPAEIIRTVTCPVFALYGEKDVQVSPVLNRGPMEAALKQGGNPRSRVVVVPGANHLFQEARTGNVAEYSLLKKEFAPGVVNRIVEFLKEPSH